MRTGKSKKGDSLAKKWKKALKDLSDEDFYAAEDEFEDEDLEEEGEDEE